MADEFDEKAKVLKSDLKYVENEDIEAIRYEDGKLTVLSKKDGNAYERVFDTSSEWLTVNTYKITRGRDVIAVVGPMYASLVSGTVAALTGNPLLLVPIASLVAIPPFAPRFRRHGEYNKKVGELQKASKKDAQETIGDEIQGIGVYLGGIEEVERKTGRKLEPIETSEKTYSIEEKNDFWLRANASGLGADAVINFRSEYVPEGKESVRKLIGTPVRFVDGDKRRDA